MKSDALPHCRAPGRPRRRVLLLDSENASPAFETRLATQAHVTVDTAADLATAWRRLGETHYDLVIANARLLQHCGRDLEWWFYEAGVTVPVILMRGAAPVGVINPSGQPAPWFAGLDRHHFHDGGLVALVRKILPETPVPPARTRHPAAA